MHTRAILLRGSDHEWRCNLVRRMGRHGVHVTSFGCDGTCPSLAAALCCTAHVCISLVLNFFHPFLVYFFHPFLVFSACYFIAKVVPWSRRCGTKGMDGNIEYLFFFFSLFFLRANSVLNLGMHSWSLQTYRSYQITFVFVKDRHLAYNHYRWSGLVLRKPLTEASLDKPNQTRGSVCWGQGFKAMVLWWEADGGVSQGRYIMSLWQ